MKGTPPMLFKELRKRREQEQLEFDAVIQEAAENEKAEKAAEKAAWGCGISVPATIDLQMTPSEEALLAPLRERALCTRDYPDLFEDKAAVHIMNVCPSATFKQNPDAQSYLLAYEQSHYIGVAKNFLRKHPRATVVEIGCGLSTIFYQLDNKKSSWIEVDVPEALSLRNKLGFDKSARVQQLACDPQDFSWMGRITTNRSKGAVFIAHIQHRSWSAATVKQLAIAIKERFPHSLLLLCCVGGKAGDNVSGFRCYSLNAKSVFHAWFDNDPQVQVFETTYPPKEVLEDFKREEKKRINRLYRDGSQILIDLKFAG